MPFRFGLYVFGCAYSPEQLAHDSVSTCVSFLRAALISRRCGLFLSVNDESVCALADGCPNLRAMTLADCRSVTVSSIAHLLSKCPSLYYLNIEKTPFAAAELNPSKQTLVGGNAASPCLRTTCSSCCDLCGNAAFEAAMCILLWHARSPLFRTSCCFCPIDRCCMSFCFPWFPS